jgi:ParB family chromosome partitioning protein
MAKSIKDMLAGVPKAASLVAQRADQPPSAPKTAPGQLMSYIAKESEALKENDELKRQIADLKAAEVSIDALVEVDGRKRTLAPEEFQELRENVRQHGLTTPITVRPLPGGKYEVVSGHNRVAVFKELGMAKIPAFIRDYSDQDAERGAFYANLLHRSLPDYEKYLGFKRIMELTGKNQSEIAEEAGIAKQTVSSLMLFDQLSSEVRAKVAEKPGAVGYNFVRELKSVKDPVRAISALIDEGCSPKEAIKAGQLVDTQQAKPAEKIRQTSVQIKDGRTKVAEISVRGAAITVRLAAEGKGEAVALEIERAIRGVFGLGKS